MVSKKYLCAAPRPEYWEERAQALLDSFGGNAEKRDETLRQTLQQLKATRNYERRTGPGRKSNAEHAIAFYEYVLGDEEEEDDDDDISSSSSSNNSTSSDDEGGGAKKKTNSKKIVDGENKEDDDEEEDREEEKTIESMDSQEFLNQHNDDCDVCNLGGELLCCSTCTLVFHLECVRPKLEALPDGDWACSYCVLSGNQYKKSSKVWKTAAAAVRHMGRLRKSKQRETQGGADNKESGDEHEKHEKDPKKDETESDVTAKEQESSSETADGVAADNESPSAAETEKHDNKSAKTSDQPKKPSLALYKISDALSPTFKVEPNESTGRGRRPRRQPILYDPQICPDSRWRSDELLVDTKRSDDEEDTDAGGEEGEQTRSSSKRRRRSRDAEGKDADAEESSVARKPAEEKTDASTSVSEKEKTPSKNDDPSDEKKGKKFYWCNFCRDDPNIPICVFCACRVCYGKHEKEKILLCDQCDEEYHTFCLKPPLSSIPTKKWFCPTCKAASSASVADTKVSTRHVSSSPTQSTTGGTPTSTRGSSVKNEKVVPTTPKSASKSSFDGDSNISPLKRPRGRPPKIKSPQPVQQQPLTGPTPPPRKRGRPPKNAQFLASPPPTTTETPTPRKRGRPPKNPTPPIVAVIARKKPGPKPGSTNKRSVSPSARKAVAPPPAKKARTDQPVEEGPEPEPIKISRSGRIVKRSSFHDEVEEGEQHLRNMRRNELEGRTTKLQSEEEGSHGDSAGDITMGTEEDTAIRDDYLIGHGCEDDDEASVDTGDGRPVRTKVIKPPNSTVEESLPLLPMEVDEPKPISPEPKPEPTIESILERVPEIVSQSPAIQEQEVAVAEVSKKEKPSDDSQLKTVGLSDTKSEDPAASSTEAPISVEKEAEKVPAQGSTVEKIMEEVAVPSAKPAAKPAAPTKEQEKEPAKSKAVKASHKVVPPPKLDVDVKALVKAAIANIPTEVEKEMASASGPVKVPRRKPGARECMQISRRFGVRVIPKKYMDTLLDYCTRGKVEHLIRMRERLDEHSRSLEAQLAGLEAVVREKGETDVVVPQLPERAHTDTPVNNNNNKSSLSSSIQPMNVTSYETASTSSSTAGRSIKSTSSSKPTTTTTASAAASAAAIVGPKVPQSVSATAGKPASKIPPPTTGAASKPAASVKVKPPTPAVPPAAKAAPPLSTSK